MNTIVNYGYNASFNARYLKIKDTVNFPHKVSKEIYKNQSIHDFLYPPKKKSILEKFLDMFKKDEVLEVRYSSKNIEGKNPYAKIDCTTFLLRYKGTTDYKSSFSIYAAQQGIKGADGEYKKPLVSSVEAMAEKISKWKLSEYDFKPIEKTN